MYLRPQSLIKISRFIKMSVIENFRIGVGVKIVIIIDLYVSFFMQFIAIHTQTFMVQLHFLSLF